MEKGKEREMLKNYKELKVWEKAYQVCLDVYRITKGFPKHELYGLASQMQRAAANIAEGYGRKTTPDYVRALYIAYGSNCELETQVMLSKDLGYISVDEKGIIEEKIREVERMLKGLMTALESKHSAA